MVWVLGLESWAMRPQHCWSALSALSALSAPSAPSARPPCPPCPPVRLTALPPPHTANLFAAFNAATL